MRFILKSLFKHRRYALAFAAVMICLPLAADQIILHTGGRLTGSIESEVDGKIKLIIEGGSVTVRQSQIAQIIRDAPPSPSPVQQATETKQTEASSPTSSEPEAKTTNAFPEAIASSTEKEAPHSSKTVLTKDVQNKAPLESRTLVLIGVGVAGGITALSLMFKPFFGDFSGFLDCVRYTIQPNWISAFTGEFFDDFWGEFKLYIWFVAGILVGLACSVGVGRFWVP